MGGSEVELKGGAVFPGKNFLIQVMIPGMMSALFISSFACLVSPEPVGVPRRAPTSGGISCRVLRLTNESKILKYSEPEYPRNTGTFWGDITVYLTVDVDQEGRVKDTGFFWSDRSFGEAAALAVKGWVFEPIMFNGAPAESSHAVEITFLAKRNEVQTKAWHYPNDFRAHRIALQNTAVDRPSRVLRRVDPIYPESARRGNIEGAVALEALVSEEGRVEAVLLWKSIPELDDAAIEAYNQWIFEPRIVDNNPRKFITFFHVRFRKR
jgi:TonB family protein